MEIAHFRSREALDGIFSLCTCNWKIIQPFSGGYIWTWKKQFSRVPSCGLKWDNKETKPQRSIGNSRGREGSNQKNLPWVSYGYFLEPHNKHLVSNKHLPSLPSLIIASKAKGTLHWVKSHNLVSFLLASLTMDFKLQLFNLKFLSCCCTIEKAYKSTVVDPHDILRLCISTV